MMNISKNEGGPRGIILTDRATERNSRGRIIAWLATLLIALSAAACNRPTEQLVAPSPVAATTRKVQHRPEATSAQVHELCGACHAYPPPDSFPRWAWRGEVTTGFGFFANPTQNNPVHLRDIHPPSLNQVVAYYEQRAPVELQPIRHEEPETPAPVHFDPTDIPTPEAEPYPAVSNVNLVHLTDPKKLDLLACDMRFGKVMLLKPYEPHPTWRTLAAVPNPAHTEVVDLDGDGIKDILVANLGNFLPTDEKKGSVVWLRGQADGSFKPITLLSNVGRVADVEAADFYGHGKLDLIVAVFGWRNTGSIILLENQTTDWNHPRFVPHVLDHRAGAIHVPVCDMNGDGKPDFVALISQEFETVVAFLNDGNGQFKKKTIYTGPHPAFGSTGIQVVDLDGDGRLDVLYTNGDNFDPPSLLKPYQGIHWLRNRGTYPFEDHVLAPMYGAHRAVAADFRGTGRLDVVACSLLPASEYPMRRQKKFDSVIYLEQVAPGQFVRHPLETGTCDHATCVAGAWDGDGRIGFVTGNFSFHHKEPIASSVRLWKNVGRQP
jgi:hypothetical protein